MSSLVIEKRSKKAPTAAFSVRQMLAGLELDTATDSVLRYLDFFTAFIPVKALRILHVIPRFELFEGLQKPGSAPKSPLGMNKAVYDEVAQRILMHPLYKQTRVLSDLREGNPLEQLLAESEAIQADLLVIGQRTDPHEHSTLAANLLRKTKANVLLVPEGAKAGISHILVPIDFSRYSVSALEKALAIRHALKQPVKITCLNVFELPNLNIYLVEKMEDVRQLIRQDRMAAMQDFLHQYAATEEIEIALVERETESVSARMASFAQETKADLIVAGARGHSKVERLLLGSVSENLLRMNGQIPVLITHTL